MQINGCSIGFDLGSLCINLRKEFIKAMDIFKAGIRYFFYLILILIVSFTIGVIWPVPNVEPVYTAKPIVITDVSIIDVENGTTIPHQSVLISDQRIIAVDVLEKLSIPEDALRINGTNRFLIPSLWDMHAHIYKVTPLLDMPL